MRDVSDTALGTVTPEETRALIASRIILTAALIIAVCVEIAARIGSGPGIWASMRDNLFTQMACAAPYMMYQLWERDPRRARWAIVPACAAISAAVFSFVLGWLPLRDMLTVSLLGIGLVGLGLMVVAALSPRTDHAFWRERFTPAIYLPLGAASAPFFLWLSGQANPVYDLYVFAFEETLGPRFSVLAVHLFEALPPLYLIAGLCYFALPLGIATLYAMQQRGRIEADIAMAFVVSTAIGFSLYFVFPVVGPLTLYGAAFPDNLPAPGSIAAADLMIAARAPRNGMPSLHTAWALLIWFNARPLAAMSRQLFRAFAVLNLLATMGLLDAHWLTDLVVGAPLAISVQALCSVALPFRCRVRWTAVATGFALVGAWFAALWWGLGVFEAVPGLSWFAVALTLAVVAALERLLRTVPMAGAEISVSSRAL